MADRDQIEQHQEKNKNEQEDLNFRERTGQPQETSGPGNKVNGKEESESQGARKSNRGFAAMSPERQKAIASEGGRAAHRQGVAHEWSSNEARQAGRKGGQAVSQNREHMSEIGRKGGQRSGNRRSTNERNEGSRENELL